MELGSYNSDQWKVTIKQTLASEINSRSRQHLGSEPENFGGRFCIVHRASQVALVVKNPPANAGDMGALLSGSGRSPGGGNDKQLQYSCLETPMNSMKRATVCEPRRVRHGWDRMAKLDQPVQEPQVWQALVFPSGCVNQGPVIPTMKNSFILSVLFTAFAA